MSMRTAIVDAALAWVGTPYVSRAYPRKGLCCDCATLLPGIGMELGIFPSDLSIPAYSADRHLHRSDEAYREALLELGFMAIAPAAALPGDVLLQVIGARLPASHAGIVIECSEARPTWWVHASNRGGLERVARMRLDEANWTAMRFAFRYPGIGDDG